MFEHQLAGVRFVLAVVHVDVELISLKRGEKRGEEEEEREGIKTKRLVRSRQTRCSSSSHPGDEAVTHVFRQLLVVHQLLQENAAGTQRDEKEGEEEGGKESGGRGTRGRR